MFGNAVQSFSGYKTRGDLAAWQFLEEMIGDFSRILGEPKQELQWFVFQVNTPYLKNVQVCYEIEKRFLGKIYALIFEGRVPILRTSDHYSPIHLSYSGKVKKGRPFFEEDHATRKNPLVQKLNRNDKLIELCWSQDLEYLKIYCDVQEEVCRIRYRPFGGSFVRLLFPPLRYSVKLPDRHAQYMVKSMKLIGEAVYNCVGFEKAYLQTQSL
jgi:hypothetical protein